jgi:spore coat polysaccharide biosynthesis protein SpsF (cytidylyltransferase family)
MGSTRLPGKVLKDLDGKPILEQLIDRIAPSRTISKLVVATTTNQEDDAIEAFCRKKGITCSRGSDWDVLARFFEAAKPFKPDTVIRLTSDCPLHHYKVVDFVVEEFKKSGFDYFSNSNHEPEVIEDGFDTEVFTFAALETAFHEAALLSEREHVTPFIKNSGKFRCGWKAYHPAYKYKLSVDSEDDFRMAAHIFAELRAEKDFGMEEVIALLQHKPEILALNKNSVPNAGYRKSIENDKPVN